MLSTPLDDVKHENHDDALESGGVVVPLAPGLPSTDDESSDQSLHKKHDSLLQQPHYEGEKEGEEQQ